MGNLSCLKARAGLWGSSLLAVISLSTAFAEPQSGRLLITAVNGTASYSVDNHNWIPLGPGMTLESGATLKTGDASTADLILKSSGTSLRLTPNSVLELRRLKKVVAGEEVITE